MSSERSSRTAAFLLLPVFRQITDRRAGLGTERICRKRKLPFAGLWHRPADIGNTPPAYPAEGLAPLLGTLRQLIADSRQQVLRVVDVVQVHTYWHIGQHIVEFEQGGAQRATYGQRLLPQLGQALSAEFGRGFDATNLRHMREFYLAFPIRAALRRELNWTHYRLLLREGSAEARQWYVQEAAAQNWSTRALERQIGSRYYERLLLSQDKAAVSAEAQTNLGAMEQSPRTFVRDPVMLEFLGLPNTGHLPEATLETALMDKPQQFLMELGKGFAFVARHLWVTLK